MMHTLMDPGQANAGGAGGAGPACTWDVFVSHASEDKAGFVEPLVAELRARGLQVWYDRHEIKLGDQLRAKLDEGLRGSRFGVVVLSPRVFKYWPEAEWDALFAQEAAFGEKRILPIRLDLSQIELVGRSPLLAGRVSGGWEEGIPSLASRIHDAVRSQPLASGARRSPVYNLPSRATRQLFGRASDLDLLASKLQPGRSVRLAASIEGLAGVGKTELALHLVDRLAAEGRFPGGIFWLDAERPDLTVAWGGPIADALAVGAAPVAERAAAAVRIVSGGPPALLVLDNVERWARDNAPGPLPTGAHVALLVTTRQAFLAGRAFEHHALDCLPPDAARALLLAVAGRDLDVDGGLEDLLEHLGGHALAVELAGAYLHEFRRVSAREYLARRSGGQAVDEEVVELVRYERTVKECFDTTWTRLEAPVARALGIAACFGPEDASLALLESCGVNDSSCRGLERLHLITTTSDRWRMHRLVRAYARAAWSPDQRSQAQAAVFAGCVEFSRRIGLATGFRVYASDGTHLEAAIELARSQPGTDPRHLSELLDRVGTALQSAGEFRRARELIEAALASDLKDLGEDHPTVATRRSNLAGVLQDLGELGPARKLLEAAVASDLKNFGEDHPEVATGRANLALVLKSLGELGPARELLEAALASALKNLGEDHPAVATRRSNLALVLQDLGELGPARELLEAALASGLKNLGEGHPAVATRRSNLAGVLQDLGELGPARELFEAALASAFKNLGEDHPTVATCRFNLAQLLEATRDTVGASALLEAALASQSRCLGPDHVSTSFTRVRLARHLQALGQHLRARTEAERALGAVASQPPGSQYRVAVEREARRILGDPT
jgi:tetratricopeptide (TPR) repeat protein